MPVRARRPDDEAEVLGVGNLVLVLADRIDPPPAVDQPAIVRDGVEGGELGAPPYVGLRLLVDDRLGAPWLAVALVAEEDALGARRTRESQPHDRLPAELVGPLDDVFVGAVVVRPVEQPLDVHGGERHPLTDPAVRPPTIQRCRKRNRIVTGIIAISEPAANGPQCWP